MSLTSDQARALWDAGGFALLQGLPAGSEAGMDGTFHTIRSFAGHKFVPPGFHLIVWCASPSASGSGTAASAGSAADAAPADEVEEIATPGAAADASALAAAAAAAAAAQATSDLASAFPIRVAYAHTFSPRERVRIIYDSASESATVGKVDEAALPALDAQLAPYPFAQLEAWKLLSTHITTGVVKRVLGQVVFVDSLTGEEGGDEIGALRAAVAAGRRAKEEAEKVAGASEGNDKEGEKTEREAEEKEEHRLQFPVFDLKRSWATGATGDELSKWSRDKSHLLARVCAEVGGPSALLGQLQLAFLLITNVWNFASLGAYKRILSLFCRSAAAMAGTSGLDFGSPSSSTSSSLQTTYFALVKTITAQLAALPATAFDTELPDMDSFYLNELEQLRKGLGEALAERSWWGAANTLVADWQKLQKAGHERGWQIGELNMGDEDSEEEEGEYAPMVVE